MSTRLLSLLFSGLLMLALLGGCTTDSDSDTDTGATTTTAATTVSTTAAPDTTDSIADPATYNRLTGEYNNNAGSRSRAVGIMIANNSKARPQTGLSTADVFFETETEGGITRIMAIYSDASRVPSQLCPVRSCRSPFVLMAQSMDLVYVHAGGSVAGLQTLSNSGIDEIDALSTGGNIFWRDDALRTSRGLEYSLCASGTNLTKRIQQLKLRDTSDRTPFTFSNETVSGTACNELQVTHSGSQTNCFVYNSDTKLYRKYLGKLGSASTHTTTDGGVIDVTNVVVMYDTKYAENDTTINFNLNSGSGLLCSGGQSRQIRWSRTSGGLTFTETDGTTATFLPGKTYIMLVTSANASYTVVR